MVTTVKVNVLGYMEDEQWVAHALEMNIIGVGDSWEEALSELDGNVQAQVSFAKHQGDPSLIFQPAPDHFFEMFRQAREAELRALVKRTRKKASWHQRTDNLGIPDDLPSNGYALA